MGLLSKLFGTYSDRELKRIHPISDKVLQLEDQFSTLSDKELQEMTPKLKQRLEAGETLDDILPEAFATCREAAWRVLGMKHFPVQVIGGIVLHQGRIAEMRTGEGKTLVSTLPAYLNALSGNGVHIVTVNDYLAKRDSEWMGKVHRFLGLTVGLAISGMQENEKRAAYACDITYGTNNEYGFDYLRDNMAVYRANCVQRGFNFAIVDEVDSILVDEARTPLIISGRGEASSELYAYADKFAKTLTKNKIAEVNEKEEHDHIEGDYIIDEKARTATLTPSGVKKVEQHFKIENLHDPDNVTLAHHMNLAIRANGIMHRDTDYVVKDNEVIIVDEFTGRLMIGRRYNEGLHQAIEAKENVKVADESKTLATITFQNYFRMYKKLSGMTGTALTEENEFREIYKLDVIVIPTNKDVMRTDHEDLIYKNIDCKYDAVIQKVIECNKKGQPVLVGTVSIENSEILSKKLARFGVTHEVLNAKHHQREAQIVSQAGKLGAVTIATNMAGRGTDIMLGGNPEFLAKAQMSKEGMSDELIEYSTSYFETDNQEILGARITYHKQLEQHKEKIKNEAETVKRAGGLMIIGTERHESRRIDNQLRGRAGRQGDPGETRFFLSLEDELMRLFGGERIQSMMNTLKVEDDQPIEAKILSGTIESAQAKVEGRNFGIRKNVLQFDDVMNRQREIIYGQRGSVLNGDDLSATISKMIDDVIVDIANKYLLDGNIKDDWNLAGLRSYLLGWITEETDLVYTLEELENVEKSQIIAQLTEKAHKIYDSKTAEYGENIAREVERMLLLRNVDTQWMDHIDAMDDLRRGIYLRSYAQKDPVVEYRLEGFEMFDTMIQTIREDTVKMLLTLRVRTEEADESPAPIQRVQVAKPSPTPPTDSVRQPVKNAAKAGRNDPCPCGSGQKYKKCCGK